MTIHDIDSIAAMEMSELNSNPEVKGQDQLIEIGHIICFL